MIETSQIEIKKTKVKKPKKEPKHKIIKDIPADKILIYTLIDRRNISTEVIPKIKVTVKRPLNREMPSYKRYIESSRIKYQERDPVYMEQLRKNYEKSQAKVHEYKLLNPPNPVGRRPQTPVEKPVKVPKTRGRPRTINL